MLPKLAHKPLTIIGGFYTPHADLPAKMPGRNPWVALLLASLFALCAPGLSAASFVATQYFSAPVILSTRFFAQPPTFVALPAVRRHYLDHGRRWGRRDFRRGRWSSQHNNSDPKVLSKTDNDEVSSTLGLLCRYRDGVPGEKKILLTSTESPLILADTIGDGNSMRTGGRTSRRDSLHRLGIFLATAASFSYPPVAPAGAACLPGDDRPTCIGIYKVPIDDKILKYVETPEKLKAFAPDLDRWVPPVQPPSSYGSALAEMRDLSVRTAELKEPALRGRLEEAGVRLLVIIPRVTVCGRVIVEGIFKGGDEFSMKAYRAEVALQELEAGLGWTDVTLGQALRGQLGVSAPAQLQVLAELNDAVRQFEEFLQVAPEKFVSKDLL